MKHGEREQEEWQITLTTEASHALELFDTPKGRLCSGCLEN